MVILAPSDTMARHARALEPPYPSFTLAVSEMEGESDSGQQFQRAAPSRPVLQRASIDSVSSPFARPILQHTHSLKRVSRRSTELLDDNGSMAMRASCDNKRRSVRPELRLSWGDRTSAVRKRSTSLPTKFTPAPKPSNATVMRVLFVDWCVSVKDKCKAIV
ncbi:hypothetical protein VTO73DRAFT_13636 [Trametes versicolor]